MNQKRYWMRGLGIGLLVYVVVAVVMLVLTFGGLITCNEFITVGEPVKESFLCNTGILLIGLPIMVLSELGEDIATGTLTHLGLYLALLGGLIIYLGICSLLGVWYGKTRTSNG